MIRTVVTHVAFGILTAGFFCGLVALQTAKELKRAARGKLGRAAS